MSQPGDGARLVAAQAQRIALLEAQAQGAQYERDATIEWCAAEVAVLVEALEQWPCLFCNGLGWRGPYERETLDWSEEVPRHRCVVCSGTGIDPPKKVRDLIAVALASLAAKHR